MNMTLEQAERIREDMGLKEGATAVEWGRASILKLGFLEAAGRVVIWMEAYAVLHAAGIAEERDRLRAAIATAFRKVWQSHGICPFCDYEDGPGSRWHWHEEGCPVLLYGPQKETACPPEDTGCPTAQPPSIPAPETCDPPELIGDTLRRCGYFGKGGTT
jgi:hypothetical protein